jgi:PAS domain S-box-containing protein
MGYKLEELVDIPRLQALFDRLNEINSFPSAIIDNEGRILTATAWQDICTQFHRKHPECVKECIKSDQYILQHLHEANPAVCYQCPHGLIDNAIPIVIGGRHLANFFTGQFFLKPPNLDFFRKQAQRFGFDEAAYLEAVRKVPIWTGGQRDKYLAFIRDFIEMLAEIGLKNQNEIETRRLIQESEKRYRTLFDQASDGIMLMSTNGQTVTVNESFARMHGYRPEDMARLGLPDLDTPETQALAPERLGRLLAGEHLTFEVEHYHKDGHRFPLSVSCKVVQFDGQSYYLGFHRDITESKRSAAALQEITQRFELAIRSGNMGVWDWDIVTPTMIWDDRMRDLYGLAPGTPIQGVETWKQLLHPDDMPRAVAEVEAALRGDKPFDTEFRILRPDGSVRYIKASGLVLRDPSGQPTRMIGLNTDITERHRTEHELCQAKEAAEAANRAKSAFLATMSHELRTPLNAVLGFTELTLQSTLTPSQRESLEIVRSRGRDLLMLLNDVLDLSRIEADRLALVHEPLSLSAVVSNVLGMMTLTAADKRLALEQTLAPDLPEILYGDAQRLRQILVNLVGNAVKFTHQGAVHVSAERSAEQDPAKPDRLLVHFTVRDTGIGIPAENLAQIFEPFSQVDSSHTRRFGGAGLGLAIVKRLVQMMDGRVWVESEPGRGSAFHFTACFETIRTSEPQDDLKKTTPTEKPSPVLRILLVEDDDSSRLLAERILYQMGHTVTSAGTGLDALSLLTQTDFDLVLMDIKMPEMDGLEATRRIRSPSSQVRNPAIPIVALTAYAMKSDETECLEAGMDGFVSKPLQIADLAAAMAKATAGSPYGPPIPASAPAARWRSP